MKQCIDYALANLTECNLSFSFTTNLTLMTEEIADYLGLVPNLSIVLSMDGPAEYPSKGTVPESYYLELQEKGYDVNAPVNWFQWAESRSKNKDFITNRMNLYTNVLEASLTKIHNRPVFNEPINISYCNGCCIPGQRRLYVCTDGTYKVCERVGDSPSIGNVDNGVDTEAIKKYYLHEYEEKSIRNCSNCWALRLCDICYADCYDQNGINVQMKAGYCEEVRERYNK